MPDALVINAQITLPASELRFTFARSSGPGGQNVNKVNTKALLRWNVRANTSVPFAVKERLRARHGNRINEQGELLLSSDEHRERSRNVASCLDRLQAILLSVVTPPRARKATRPSRGARERRLQSKQRRSAIKKLRQKPASE